MLTKRTILGVLLSLWIPVCVPCAVLGEVTALQQGVSPTGEYAGCRDTAVSTRNQARSSVLRCDGRADVLIRFDLSPIPAGHVVHKAVLRLASPGYPRPGREGKFASSMACYRVAGKWDEEALYQAYREWYKKYRRAKDRPPAPSAKVDRETDFGQGTPGLVASDALGFDPAVGHVHELDLTELVKRWRGGDLPNHGLALRPAGKARSEIATSEWHVPAARPKLIIDHGPKASGPKGVPPLPGPISPDKLDPAAAMPDTGEASGDYAAVRVGQNATCALRGASTDAYVKEAHEKYPGPWGWMNMSRVGGRAGDVSRALLYFDLAGVPKTASIKQARLVLSLTPYRNDQVRNYRYGAFVLKVEEAPGFSAEEATALERKADTPWPKGGVMAASGGQPVAVGEVADIEVEDSRGRKRKVPGTMTFDLTGLVRAWVLGKVPNGGVVLDNRLEGGAYDFYSARSYKPDKRPYLEITLSPAVAREPKPVKVAPRPPAEAEWVPAMRQAHQRFDGKAGVLTQYGDSITVTMAYLAPYGGGGKINPKNMTPEVAKEMAVVEKYADLKLWKDWKSSQWGCTGMKTSAWWFAGVDAWQKRMNPEAAVILFGTNDAGGICPPQYTEYMAASVRRLLADGTVPMLTTVPPKGSQAALKMLDDYWLALICIASHYKIPVIDYYKETLRRRPEDWNGRLEKFRPARGYDVPTIISGDGCHPSNPKAFQNDFSEKALSSNGYNLRNYMTLRTYSAVITKVFQSKE